jgi:hypothetical protein
MEDEPGCLFYGLTISSGSPFEEAIEPGILPLCQTWSLPTKVDGFTSVCPGLARKVIASLLILGYDRWCERWMIDNGWDKHAIGSGLVVRMLVAAKGDRIDDFKRFGRHLDVGVGVMVWRWSPLEHRNPSGREPYGERHGHTG